MSIPLSYIVIFSFSMFSIGLYGFMKSRNAIRMLACLEIMLNSANVNLVAFAVYKDVGDLAGQVLAIFIIAIAAAEAAMGLAIFLLAFKHAQTADVATFRSYYG